MSMSVKKTRAGEQKLIEMRYNSTVKRQLMNATLDGAMSAYAATGFAKKDSAPKHILKAFD